MGEVYHQSSLFDHPQNKTCSRCGATKAVNDFPTSYGKPKSYCKSCHIAANRIYCQANPERRRATVKACNEKHAETRRDYARSYYQRVKGIDPDAYLGDAKKRTQRWREANRERHRASVKQYRKDHPQWVRESQRARDARNRDKIAERRRRSRREHPERWARARHLDWRRSQLRRNPESVAYALLIEQDPCSYCGAPPVSHIDHIVPVSDGGSNHWTNLTAACRHCNSSKKNRPLWRFLMDA